jgi:hypothetical protein
MRSCINVTVSAPRFSADVQWGSQSWLQPPFLAAFRMTHGAQNGYGMIRLAEATHRVGAVATRPVLSTLEFLIIDGRHV